MELFTSVSSFVGMFILMIFATLWLKSLSVLKEDHSSVLSGIVTELLYPALIFTSLAQARISLDLLLAATTIIFTVLLGAGILWLFGTQAVKLARPKLLALLLAGSFGSGTLLGSVLLQVVFQDKPELISNGLVITQFSESLMFNIFGLFLAIHYSDSKKVPFNIQIKKFFLSKPILAMAAGLAWNLFSIPNDGYPQRILFGTLHLLGASLPFFAAMITGLTFNLRSISGSKLLLICAVLVQLCIQPLITIQLDVLMGLSSEIQKVTLLVSALPAGALGVAFCARYNGDVNLASSITVITTAVAAITLPIAALLI